MTQQNEQQRNRMLSLLREGERRMLVQLAGLLRTTADEINAELDTYLREKFDQYGIIIDTVNFTDISVDDETAAAIQKKVTAQQELELANIEKQTAKVQAEKDREVAQINAEKAVIEAEAKAETLRIAAEAEADANRKIAASLTNELIEKIKYEQWNGELPTVTGSTPIISLEP